MQKKKQLKKTTYSNFKSLKNRLSFVSHKKKGFLDKKENIEILELEDIEVLDFEEEPLGVVEEIEQLEIDEDVKLTKQKIRLKPLVKKRIQYASYALGAFAVLLLSFSFLMNYNTSTISISKILTRLGIYTEEIPLVEDVSNDYSNPGSIKVSTTAKWIDLGKAQITVNLQTVAKPSDNHKKDVILVMDASNAMVSSDYSRIRDGFVYAIKSILSDEENKVAFISFDSEATILSSFTRDEESLTNAINAITPGGRSNYYKALQKVDEVLQDYEPQENHDVIVVFFAGGASLEGTSNEESEYQVLKDKYPYLTINGIKYYNASLGSSINRITDSVREANISEINNVLVSASLNPETYDKLIITDYLEDGFAIDPDHLHTQTSGTVTITEEGDNRKIVWNLGSNFPTGGSGVLKIYVRLKEEYQEVEGFYPTHQSRTVVYQIHNNSEKVMNSTQTLVMKNKFSIIYNTNPPEGCDIENTMTEKQFVFKTVQKKTEELTCDGYLFKGWEIDESENEDITYINNDAFIMPSHDVHINGTWAKQEISKSMNGTVFEKMSLYDAIAKDAGTAYVKEYTYPHQDSMDPEKSTEKVYYYDGNTATNNTNILKRNNVIFAGQCWQMFRTTDTGGVKMIYNGEAVNGKCLSSRGKHAGYREITERTFSDTYYYGTSYLFNKSTNKYSLSGDVRTGEIPVGYYTCLSTVPDGNCSYLYYISESTQNNKYLSYSLYSDSDYSFFGELPFNRKNDSTAYSGYMYNTEFKNAGRAGSYETIYNKSTYNAAYYFGSDYEKRNSNYVLSGNTFTGSSVADVSELVGNYTLLTRNLNQTTNPPRYVAAVLNNKIYNITMQNGQKIEDVDIDYYYGTDVTELGDGYFSINNLTHVKRSNWIQYYSDVQGKYLCEEALYNNQTACTNLKYVYNSTDSDYGYVDASVNIKFSNSFNYEDGKYYLNDNAIYKREIANLSARAEIDNYRYTCWNNSGECETVSAIYQISNTVSFINTFYLNITGGLSMDEALNSMLFDNNVNQKDSIIKKGIDLWYKYYIDSYSSYVDDVIYCNDRRISRSSFFGNSLQTYSTIEYSANNRLNSLKCENITDSFSNSNDIAYLQYYVGLLTNEEAYLMGQAFRNKGDLYYTMSPKYLYAGLAENKVVDADGYINTEQDINMPDGMIYDNFYVNYPAGVRPVIALNKDVDIIGGDGSQEDPYIVDYDVPS